MAGAFNPDGSPNPALNQYRRKAILARKDKGQITKNFHLYEFSCHDGSYVPSKAHGAIDRLATAYLEPMRAKFGACTILSGYRHRAYNRRIGGAIHSQHIYDVTPDTVAADLRFARGNPKQWAAYAKQLRAKYKKGGGIGTYVNSGFTHVDNRHYSADWSGMRPKIDKNWPERILKGERMSETETPEPEAPEPEEPADEPVEAPEAEEEE